MTRNQKIALGCGGAGCLGLIVVVIAGCLLYYFYYRSMSRYDAYRRDYNFNVNLNSNSNANDDSNSNSSNSNSSSSASSLSDDDKHKLFQAGAMSGDSALALRVNVKIGLLNDDNTPAAGYQEFMAEHISWAIRDREFIMSINTPEKAKAYVDEHLPE